MLGRQRIGGTPARGNLRRARAAAQHPAGQLDRIGVADRLRDIAPEVVIGASQVGIRRPKPSVSRSLGIDSQRWWVALRALSVYLSSQ
jgi:hypothetical protein